MKKFALVPVMTLAAVSLLGGCQKKDVTDVAQPAAEVARGTSTSNAKPAADMAPITIVSIETGSAIDADSLIATRATAFKPKDTIYAVINYIADADATPGKLSTKWENTDGTVIAENTEDFVFNKSGHLERRISNEGGLPVGKYKLTVSANGGATTVAEFDVAN